MQSSRFFVNAPDNMSQFTSALADVFKAIRAKLVRTGVNVGGTASYPRVEIHSVVEDTPQTKDMSLRSVTATIECVSAEKVADIVTLADDNIELIFDAIGLSLTNWNVIGIVPGQMRMFDEEASQDNAAVIYRLLHDVTVWIERKDVQPDDDDNDNENTES